MAYMAAVAGLAFPLMILFTNSVELDKIAMPFYTFATAIVVAYIGGAVVDDNNFKDVNREKT